ncbi:hypothetical protein Tco_0175348 [Tanacetum coccineum]
MRNVTDAKTLWEAINASPIKLKLNSQNVAFVSSENTSSTNKAVNTADDVTTASSQGQTSSSTYADDVIDSILKWAGGSWLTMRGKRFLKKQEESEFHWQRTVGLIRQRLDGTTATGEVTFLKECHGHQGIRG